MLSGVHSNGSKLYGNPKFSPANVAISLFMILPNDLLPCYYKVLGMKGVFNGFRSTMNSVT